LPSRSGLTQGFHEITDVVAISRSPRPVDCFRFSTESRLVAPVGRRVLAVNRVEGPGDTATWPCGFRINLVGSFKTRYHEQTGIGLHLCRRAVTRVPASRSSYSDLSQAAVDVDFDAGDV
jgi:hypothetical protein